MQSKDITISVPSIFCGLDNRKTLHIRKRNLPHWKQDGATYFITFRLTDSIPRTVFDEIERDAVHWSERAEHEKRKCGGTLTQAFLAEWEMFQRRQLVKIENTLDAGQGLCLLTDPLNRNIIAETLRFFDGERYTLHAFVIMPNHVHLSVTPHTGWELGKLLQSWKGFTSRQINQRLSRQGTFWQRDNFDRIVRNEEHFVRVIRYISNNPAKANLTINKFTLWFGECVEITETGNTLNEGALEYGNDLDVW